MNRPLEHRHITANGIRLHTALAGPVEGPLVILLHGFPEYWRGMEAQLEALAQAGYRVACPDQRGYNLSDKPQGVAAYSLDALRDDVLGLMDALGREKAFVVGHDWGAGVAWWLCQTRPQRVQAAVTLNVPHLQVLLSHLKGDWSQLRRSWYMFFFQIPRLPELLIARGQAVPFVKAIAATARQGAFTREELDGLREAWLQPGALTGMINWYRAAFRHQPALPPSPRVKVPMMLIWGAKDHALGREMAPESIALCEQGRLEVIEEATHWVQHEEPERVNALILEWLEQHKA